MKYHEAYRQGIKAYRGEPCPYPEWLLGKRCAWLAGFNDARRRQAA